jgi:hypothetical protein
MKKALVYDLDNFGQLIDADDINYNTCVGLKIICPECLQWVHLRRSNIISNYFAHYDDTDKSCSLRVNENKYNQASIDGIPRGQDLDVRLNELKDLFDLIDEKF